MAKKYLLLILAFFFFSLFLFPHFPLLAQVPAGHVVISQIQIGGGSTTDEFVELYNPTLDTINLAGWRLARETAPGATTSSNLVASISGEISPHAFFLITHQNYDGLVAKDLFYSTGSSLAPDNTVILKQKSGAIYEVVDKVGMGLAQDKEGTAALNPPVNSSIRRINYQDTDNNSVDFEIINPSIPRNSQSPADPPLTTPTPTPSPTPTLEPSPTPSPSPTIEPSPSLQPSPTPNPTPALSPTPTPQISPSPSPQISPTPSVSPFFQGLFLTCSVSYRKFNFGLFCLRIPLVECRYRERY